MPEDAATPSPSTPRKAEEARGLLGLGRASGEAPAPGAAPGLTPAETILLEDPSRRFGRYVLLDELGRGGMGVVHRAWDTRLRRVIALKLAAQVAATGETRTAGAASDATTFGIDAEALERLKREARAASRLSHPNLIRVLDAGVHEGVFYFTMDRVEGVSIADLPLPMREPVALRLLAKVARAVAYAHEQGVLHRDIKPSNLLISGGGEPVLIDFGLARDLAAPSATVTGEIFGTPSYMAPEQATGDPRRVGASADIYGLGATLYHLIAGKAPYEDLEPAQIVVAVATHPPYPVSTFQPTIAPEVEAIVSKAMAREPRDRYATATAMAEAMEAQLEGRVRPAARRPALLPWVWVFGVASALVLGVMVGVWRGASQPLVSPPPAGGPTTTAPPVRAPQVEKSHPPSDPREVTPVHRQATVPPFAVPAPPVRTSPPIATPTPPIATPPADPPAPDPTPPADPDAAWPAEARTSLASATAAFSAALATPLADRATEWRARLASALSWAEEASAKAPGWPRPLRLRADVLLTLGRYAEATTAYASYAAASAPAPLPAEGLLAEFLEWFRGARVWGEEVTPTAVKAGAALADRLSAAAAAAELEASPFLPWRAGEAPNAAAGVEGARADLAILASLARLDFTTARDAAKLTAGKGGTASWLAEICGWLFVDWNARPDALLVELADRRVRTPELWLLASWGLGWTTDIAGAEQAAVRALDARETPTPETRFQMGVVAYRKSDLDRTKQEWAAAAAADPSRRPYLADLGGICLLRGEFTEGEAALRAACAPKTNVDPATDRIAGFAEFGIACADARRMNEVTPRPKKAERTKLAEDAEQRLAKCLAVMDHLPRDKDRTAVEAPRTYEEWLTNNVRYWAKVDPWLDGLRGQASVWSRVERMLR